MDQIDSNQRAIDEDISENPPALFIDYVQSTPEQIAVLKVCKISSHFIHTNIFGYRERLNLQGI